MKQQKGLKQAKMKMFGFEFSNENIPPTFDERVGLLRGLGKEANQQFQEKYHRLVEWFQEFDAVYLLSFCAYYFSATEEGYDEELEKGHLEFPPHFQEILQALSLYLERAITAKPLFNRTGEFKKTMREIGDLMVRRLFDIPEHLKTEREIQSYHLRTEMMAHTLAVRGWAYHHQINKVVQDLCECVSEEFRNEYGFHPYSIFKLFLALTDSVTEKLNAHRLTMSRVISAKTYTQICSGYETAFSDLVGGNEKGRDEMWQRCGKDLNYFRAIILAHSDLRLQDIFSFTADAMVALSQNELTKEQVLSLFKTLSYRFGDLIDFNQEHIILDNPVHNKPFIEIENEVYFTSVWGVLPHLSVRILENFVNDKPVLSKKYQARKAKYLEEEVEKIFRNHFPGAEIYRSTVWKDVSGTEYENDLLVIVENFAVVVEAKSGLVSAAAKRGAPERLFKNLKELVEEPSEQALRFVEHLKGCGSKTNLKDKNRKEFTVDTSKLRYFIPLGVTLSQLGVVSTNLKLLIEAGVTDKTIGGLTTSIALTDLEIIFDMLPLQAQKIHYLHRRREFEATIQYVGDEMDLLAFYLDTGFNLGRKEFDNPWHFNLVLKSKELDPYIINTTQGINTKKPQPRMTKWWQDLLELIDKRKPVCWIDSSYVLLNLHYEEQKHFEKLYKQLVKKLRNKTTEHRHNWITFTSLNPERKFLIAGYPYQKTDIAERNQMMQEILYQNDNAALKGAVIIAVNIEKGHYPYSALGAKLSAELFDSRFSNMVSPGINPQ